MKYYYCDKCWLEGDWYKCDCWNTSFDIEELSDCCWATEIWDTWLCSDCKEPWF